MPLFAPLLLILASALVLLLLLSVLVVIHEAGHFLVAKKLGMKVEEFGFGLPPRAWGKKVGETIYSINWLPIGGFVKVYGEDDAGAGRVVSKEKSKSDAKVDLKRAFFARPAGQRAAVILAGVVMNAILASLIYYVFLSASNFRTEVPLYGDHKFFFVDQQNRTDVLIGDVVKNSPAEKAGIKPFTKVIAVNGEKITDTKQLLSLISKNKGKEISLTWQELDKLNIHTTRVTPRVNAPKNQGSLGVGLGGGTTAVIQYTTPVQKVLSGIIHPINILVYNFVVIKQLVVASFAQHNVSQLSEGVSGPVGIGSIVGTFLQISEFKARVLKILDLAGLLSISLAFFNVLPIPALDGGRLLFIIIEKIIGHRVDPEKEARAHQIGMAVLLSLLLLVTLKDIIHLF